jgi:hypothetical protein
MNRPDRRQVEIAPLFIPFSTATALILPVSATSSGPFKDYHEHSV